MRSGACSSTTRWRHANDLLRPILGEHSLLVLEPAEQLERRKTPLLAFHGERVQSYARLINRLISAELDRLKPGDVAVVQPIAQALTLDVTRRGSGSLTSSSAMS
jgi:cytochrome P450